MTKYLRKTGSANNLSREKKQVHAVEAEADSPESCRCKEVAKKTPSEMLRLMISDMAFWKKGKKK